MGGRPLFGRPYGLRVVKGKNITHLIFAALKRQQLIVALALSDSEDAWVRKIIMDDIFSMEHAQQFLNLWLLLRDVHLNEDVKDDITWR